MTAPFDLVRLLAHMRLESLAPTPSALVTGHSARVEAEAEPVLLGHWRAGEEHHYLVALPQGSELLAALEASGGHRVERLVARRVSFGPGSGSDSGKATPATAEVTDAKPKQRAAKVADASVEVSKEAGSKADGKRGKHPDVPGQQPRKRVAGSSGGAKRGAEAGRRRVPTPARRTPALTTVRLVGIAIVLVVAASSAALGALVAGPWAALAAVGAGSTLVACGLLAILFARRGWRSADRVEHEVRGMQRRLTAALSAEGDKTRKAVVTAGSSTLEQVKESAALTAAQTTALRAEADETRKAVAAAGSSTLEQVKESAATTQASVTRAAETLRVAQTTATSAVETAVASHAEQFADILRGELARVEELLEDTRKVGEDSRKESGGGVERLESAVSAIPKATATLMDVQDRRAAQQQVRQIQSLLSLYSLVRLRAGAPNLSGWAASPDVMLMLANELVALRPHTVLECGSGASTVWLGLVARELGLNSRIVALEHDEDFAEATRRELERHGLEEVAEVRTAPLRAAESLPRHKTPWYDEDAVRDLQNIGLVFVDGPPGTTGPMARFPVVPLLRDQLADDCVLFLDDVGRDDEREVADSWLGLLPDFRVEEPEADRGVIVFRREGA
jgi:predicted O-methyltransferase YrrM